MGDLLVGFAVHARTLTPVAGRLAENLTALLVCIDRALDACHRIYSLCPSGVLRARLGGPKGVVPLALYLRREAQELLPSSFLAFAASPGASTTSPSRRRVRVLGLCSFRCILPA